MERGPKTEFLVPVSGPVVEALGLPSGMLDPRQQPQAARVRAFIIRPGQATIMAPRTWDCAALPLQE